MDEWKRLKLALAVDTWSTRVAWVVFAVATGTAWADATRGQWARTAVLLAVAVSAVLVARWEPPLITFKDEDEES